MVTTVLMLCCLIQSPERAAKLPSLPPTFGKITSGKTKDTLILTELVPVTKQVPYAYTAMETVAETEIVKGQTVTRNVEVLVTKTAIRTVTEAVPVSRTVTTKSHKLVDLDGREVSWALHENKPVLIAAANDGLDDDYKAMFKLGTLVLVPLKIAAPPMMPAVKPKS